MSEIALTVETINEITVTVSDDNENVEISLAPSGGGTGDIIVGGDMTSLVYDPSGVAANAFDLSNHTGILDGGVFT